jgi:dephospho-CoA kinase
MDTGRGSVESPKVMLIVGITGGIGSGKTTVCGIFAALGVPIYYADTRAKEVMVTDQQLMIDITRNFGDAAYQNGVLNRQFLAEQVFSNKDKLAVLNGLVHPAVGRDFMNWVSEHQQFPYVMKEAAILFESGAYKAVNTTVLVTAPEDVRLQRVMQRDGVAEAEVRMRMTNQWPEERKVELADHTIINDGKHLLIPQVLALHDKFLKP